MLYTVLVKRKVARGLEKLPTGVQQSFTLLARDLASSGPVQGGWPNFSPIGKGRYHCHLNYRYVACWKCQGSTIEIEVYYVGSREKAPY